MPVPDPLPSQFTAVLAARVRAVLAHDLLDGERQRVEAPDDGTLRVRVRVDRSAGCVGLLEFDEAEVEVETTLGDVRAVVSVEGTPEGTYDNASGHVRLEAPLHVDIRSVLASDSTVSLTLATDASVDLPGLAATGDAFDAGDPTVRLVGSGTFEGGSLDGGTLWLVLDAEVTDVEAEVTDVEAEG